MLSRLRFSIPIFSRRKSEFLDITKFGNEQYQDIVINNVTVKKASGRHDSEARYRIIRQVLDRYKRPFEMLDIGASQGYYSFKAAHDYDCVSVMIEGNNPEYPRVGSQLLDLCRANDTLDNVILLQKAVTPEDLKRLSECESFSVVLAMNIIHWFGPRWKEVTDSILALGDNIIIETPPEEEGGNPDQNRIRKSIEEYLTSRKATVLGKVPRHTSESKMANIYLIQSQKTKLARKHWLAPVTDDPFTIASSYRSRTITKWPPHARAREVYRWKPGINLMTYMMYNGAYPLKRKIESEIRRIRDLSHNDWTANNMILQGERLSLIDWDDPAHGNGGRFSSPRVIKAHLRFVGSTSPERAAQYFLSRLIKT